MIILDDQVPILKTDLGRPEQEAAINTSDLEAGGSQIPPPPPYTPRDTEPLLPRAENRDSPGRTWRNRVWTIAAVYGVWVFTAGLLSRLLPVLGGDGHKDHTPVPTGTPNPDVPIPGVPIPGVPIPENSCLDADHWSTHTIDKHGLEFASTALILPEVTVDHALSFVSVGFAHGSIKFTADSSSEKREPRYRVFAAHPKRETLDAVTVCLNRINGGGYRMTIFSPSDTDPHDASLVDPVSYDIVVELPTDIARNHAPQLYPSLHVEMPDFDIALTQGQNIQFGSISLAATNSHVSIEPYTASDDVSIFTTNGQIDGQFRVTSALTLRGDNTSINCLASVTQSAASTSPPEVNINTSSGIINATINLHSIGTPSRGGTFAVHASGIDAGGCLDFPWAPVNSTLLLNVTLGDGVRSASPLKVTLPAAFEGAFAVNSGPGSHADVTFRREIPDPSGAGRKRDFNFVSLPRLKFGTARWIPVGLKDEGRGKGVVELSSSGDITLVV